LYTGGAGQTLSSPALIARLSARSAIVWVGPPLLAKPAGSSFGSVSLTLKVLKNSSKQSAPWVIRTPDLLIRRPTNDDPEKQD
jgi:hypothetical protein